MQHESAGDRLERKSNVYYQLDNVFRISLQAISNGSTFW